MSFDKFKITTSVRHKNIGTPKTALEKYERLRMKNNSLTKLVETFELEIEL